MTAHEAWTVYQEAISAARNAQADGTATPAGMESFVTELSRSHREYLDTLNAEMGECANCDGALCFACTK